MKRILVICAHPDDETLGLGGVAALHHKQKDEVYVLVFATGQFMRDNTKVGIIKRQNQSKRACKILGVKNIEFCGYDDQKLQEIPLVDLIQRIELSIKKLNPAVVYTHFWGDANQDHRKIYEATLIATRPTSNNNIKQLNCFEIPSSTEISYSGNVFNPNLFVNIKSVINLKIKAFNEYKNEIQKYPFPRSKKSIINRAKYWGGVIGIEYAEAFICVREIRDI